jgi:hypothetical protein
VRQILSGSEGKSGLAPRVTVNLVTFGDDDSANNRWRMRQFPIGTSHHADRFVQWFNDCFRAFSNSPPASGETGMPDLSLYRLVRRLSEPSLSA